MLGSPVQVRSEAPLQPPNQIVQVAIEKDPVIESYKAGLDRSLYRENLKLSYEERFLKAMALQLFAEELRRAGKEHRDQLRRHS